MKKVKLKRPEFYPFKLDTPKSVKDGTFTVLDENYKDVTDSILIEVSKEYGGVLRQGCEKHSFCVLKDNVEFIDESESSVKKEPKYQIYDNVFLPKRFKDELPEEVFNCRRGNEFYEFTIAYRKANLTDVDYFVAISEADGGKWEKSISRTGRWINEKFLLSREEMEAEKKKNQPNQPLVEIVEMKLSEKENTKMTTATVSKSADNSSAVTWTRNDIRNYNTILPGAMHLAKTALRWIVRFALKRAGEAPKVVRSWITIIDNFLEKHAEKAESIFQWILGWCVKNLAKIRQIPGLKDIPQLVLLEHPELAKFGEYINADAEGDLLGEAVKHAITWVQENVLGSKVLNRIGDVFSGDPKTLARIATEVSADLQKDMEEEDAESEVASAQKPAMVAPAVA